jgi:hypothetical protein
MRCLDSPCREARHILCRVLLLTTHVNREAVAEEIALQTVLRHAHYDKNHKTQTISEDGDGGVATRQDASVFVTR